MVDNENMMYMELDQLNVFQLRVQARMEFKGKRFSERSFSYGIDIAQFCALQIGISKIMILWILIICSVLTEQNNFLHFYLLSK